MVKTKIKLGDEVVDKITGFEGKVLGECNYLYGCQQYLVQPEVDDKGAWQKAHWFDAPQLKVIRANKKKKAEPKHGGDRAHP